MDKLFLFRRRPTINLLKRLMCTTQGGGNQSTNGASSIAPRYKPNEFQKFILVWTKKYKSKAEIPPQVSWDVIERSRSEARIKLSNYLILLTILASIFAVVSGKAAAKRGESVHQMNLDWHKQYEEDFKKKQESDKQ
ncbi:unnamed protein product [Euphydryas editha]|uniref:Uncharacterized protein n=1 Tax=Euphydryas editha TaxID=104508 RepID=A0AAU9V1I3_EUPED|nr:unnamed protein product [Euphydryas editha]